MTKRQKAIDRLLAKPTDFEWNELTSVMKSFGYNLETIGESARKFVHPVTNATVGMHEPHPRKILKIYQIRIVIDFLKRQGHLS